MKLVMKSMELVKNLAKLDGVNNTSKLIYATVGQDKEGKTWIAFKTVGNYHAKVVVAAEVSKEDEGSVNIALPTLFSDAVKQVSSLGEDIVLDIASNMVTILCGTAQIPVPVSSEEEPKLEGNMSTLGGVMFKTSDFKMAIGKVASVIDVADTTTPWAPCVGFKVMAEDRVRFIGTTKSSNATVEVKPTKVAGLTAAMPAMPIETTPLQKIAGNLDDGQVALMLLGTKSETSCKVSRLLITTSTSKDEYIVSLGEGIYPGTHEQFESMIQFATMDVKVNKAELTKAVNIATLTDKTGVYLKSVDGKLRVSNGQGNMFVDLACDLKGELAEVCYMPHRLLTLVSSAVGSEVTLKTEIKVEGKPGVRGFLFSVPTEPREGCVEFSALANVNSAVQKAAAKEEAEKIAKAEAEKKAKEAEVEKKKMDAQMAAEQATETAEI